jgi:ribosomal protein L12E/L44/L45/RPP1/RPP2
MIKKGYDMMHTQLRSGASTHTKKKKKKKEEEEEEEEERKKKEVCPSLLPCFNIHKFTQ